ncbi:MAG: hypothetical protein JST73_02835 [Actinobacteria bacterium]|nr:hypothetical protein [Actinomycetota bacterium]
MSDAAEPRDRPRGLSLLPPRRHATELVTHPPIEDLSSLVIDGLTDEEYRAFLDALDL